MIFLFSFCKLFLDFPNALFRILFNVMLPEPKYRPPFTPEFSCISLVTSHVALYLVAPEFFCRFLFIIIPEAMPEVTVAVDDDLLSFEDEVGVAKHLGIHLKLVLVICEKSLHLQINLGVGSSDSRHHPRSFFRSENVCQCQVISMKLKPDASGRLSTRSFTVTTVPT